jgi:glycolate oxidase
MDGNIPRRSFLMSASAATTAAVALSPTKPQAAERLADNGAPTSQAAATASAPDASNFVVLHQIVKAGHDRMSTRAWNYLMGAADTETTMRRNRQALDSIAFKPRQLRGVGKLDLSGKLLGQTMRIPVLLSGVGSVGIMDPGGGATVARAASKFGVPIGVSSEAKPGLEEIGAAGPCPKIYQLYVRGDEAWIDHVAERAIKAGYTAFGFTIDSAYFSRRERDIITGGQNAGLSDVPDPYLSTVNWDIVKRFKDRHKDVKVALKGIMTGEDADLACKAGVSVVWVSTHGGRQLDHGRGAIEALPEVVKAVKGRAEIIVDSGFSRGSDIVKGMALGANAVGIGRLYCYGLGAAGEAGVTRVLEILEKEIAACMANLGAKNLAALNRAFLAPAMPVNFPTMFSAFPMLEPLTEKMA